MGFKPSSIIKAWFKSRGLKIRDYEKLSDDDKALVDYTIKNNLRTNPILRRRFKNIKPKAFDFWSLSWSDIIMLRHNLSESDIEGVLILVYKIKPNVFLDLGMFNTMSAYKWVVEQINNIGEIERQELSSEPSSEEIDAGVEELSQFDYAVLLDLLSGGNVLLEDDILQKPYSVIFRKLCLINVKGKIQNNHIKNVSKKT